jgi:hypothetical protein
MASRRNMLNPATFLQQRIDLHFRNIAGFFSRFKDMAM